MERFSSSTHIINNNKKLGMEEKKKALKDCKIQREKRHRLEWKPIICSFQILSLPLKIKYTKIYSFGIFSKNAARVWTGLIFMSVTLVF